MEATSTEVQYMPVFSHVQQRSMHLFIRESQSHISSSRQDAIPIRQNFQVKQHLTFVIAVVNFISRSISDPVPSTLRCTPPIDVFDATPRFRGKLCHRPSISRTLMEGALNFRHWGITVIFTGGSVNMTHHCSFRLPTSSGHVDSANSRLLPLL